MEKINWEKIKEEITNEDGSLNEDVMSREKVCYIQEQVRGCLISGLETYSTHTTKALAMLQLVVILAMGAVFYSVSREGLTVSAVISSNILIAGLTVSACFFLWVIKPHKIKIAYHKGERYLEDGYGGGDGYGYDKDILFIRLEDMKGLYDSVQWVNKVRAWTAQAIEIGMLVFVGTLALAALVRIIGLLF